MQIITQKSCKHAKAHNPPCYKELVTVKVKMGPSISLDVLQRISLLDLSM